MPFLLEKRLRQTERELSVTHYPRNGAGAALRWGYNSHNGCRITADTCNRAHGKIKPNGLHCAVQSQLIRRAGLIGAEKIKPEEDDEFAQSLRADDAEMTGGKSQNHLAT